MRRRGLIGCGGGGPSGDARRRETAPRGARGAGAGAGAGREGRGGTGGGVGEGGPGGRGRSRGGKGRGRGEEGEGGTGDRGGVGRGEGRRPGLSRRGCVPLPVEDGGSGEPLLPHQGTGRGGAGGGRPGPSRALGARRTGARSALALAPSPRPGGFRSQHVSGLFAASQAVLQPPPFPPLAAGTCARGEGRRGRVPGACWRGGGHPATHTPTVRSVRCG